MAHNKFKKFSVVYRKWKILEKREQMILAQILKEKQIVAKETERLQRQIKENYEELEKKPQSFVYAYSQMESHHFSLKKEQGKLLPLEEKVQESYKNLANYQQNIKNLEKSLNKLKEEIKREEERKEYEKLEENFRNYSFSLSLDKS